uniref:Salivary sheath protein n=1 Tax=Nilaparvata lugens TaxID=108931 RepID=A0A0A1H312_NILLU|nr:salivary sheath protein [Nilaparvata lugens]
MRCFSVIALLAACISAATCMSYGSYGGAAAAYEATAGAAQQYGMEQSQSQYSASQQESSSSSSYESTEYDYAAGATSGYVGQSAQAAGAAYGAATGAGYGVAGAGYGAAEAAYGAAYGSSAYGASMASGASNYAAASSSKFSSASSMAASSASSSAAMSASASSYQASLDYYPKLRTIPFFNNVFQAMSCDDISSYSSLWTSNFNVQSTLTSMFQSNSLFKSYLSCATGMSFSSFQGAEFSRVCSAFSSNKGAFVGLVRNFARRGYIYKSSFATSLLSYTQSTEMWSAASRFSSFSNMQTWSQCGINAFFQHKAYRSYIMNFCGVQSWDENAISRTLSGYFRSNPVATSLFFRHLLLNRVSSSCSFQQYAALNQQSYMATRSSSFAYYGGFYNAFQQSSSSTSYARSQSMSSSSSSSMSSSSSSYSASRSYQSVQQYYSSTLYQSSLFRGCFELQSVDTSKQAGFYSSVFSQGYDYSSNFGTCFQDAYYRKYLLACTGYYGEYNAQMSSTLFSYAQQHPGFFARSTRLYARNGAFFSSQIGKMFVDQNSNFFFSQQVQQYRSQFLSVQAWNSFGLANLFQCRYYQRKICSFFGFSSYNYHQVSNAFISLFNTNFSGGLLALRHLIYRKYIGSSFNVQAYRSLRSYSYASSLAYSCPFYSQWSSYCSSFSQRSQFSRSAASSRSAYMQQQQSASSSSTSSYQAGAQSAAAGYAAQSGYAGGASGFSSGYY